MNRRTLVVLSGNHTLAGLLASGLAGARVITVACLDALAAGEITPDAHLVLDRLSASPCCFEQMTVSGATLEPEAWDPSEFTFDESAILNSTRPRIAWRARHSLRHLEAMPPNARCLIELISRHARRGTSVCDLAVEFGISERQMNRIASTELGMTPGLLLDLARIGSVAEELRTTTHNVTSISLSHDFRDFWSMSRRFHDFVGVQPSVYRASGVLQRVRSVDGWQKLRVVIGRRTA